MNSLWENQQKLIADQTSYDYVLSCSSRLNNPSSTTNNNNELNSILTRTTQIRQVSFFFLSI